MISSDDVGKLGKMSLHLFLHIHNKINLRVVRNTSDAT